MIKKPRALILLIPGFSAGEYDSTCIPFAQSFARNLDKTAGDVSIIILAFQYPYTSEPYSWEGIQVYPMNGRNKSRHRRLITWIKAWSKLLSLKRKFNLVGILCFWLGECALVGRLFQKVYKIPSFTWLMGQDAKPGNRFQKLIRPPASFLISLSDSLQEEYHKNYGLKPGQVIPLGIEKMNSPDTGERDIDLLSAGSLICLKNYEELLTLTYHLKSRGHHIRARLCGEGPLKEKIITLRNQLDLKDEIDIEGEVSHKNLLSLMGRSRLFIHPSSFEGNSAVCSEALAAGVHVISYTQPMKTVPDHHHIVRDFESMVELSGELLINPALDHNSVIPYRIEDTCKNILALFGIDFHANI